jgi:hypothetical protein
VVRVSLEDRLEEGDSDGRGPSLRPGGIYVDAASGVEVLPAQGYVMT